ncbi:hypothetical protein ACNOYE_34260 [Nannocystaceae bacterium ST9]
MIVDRARPWPLALLRGLLCVVLAFTFIASAAGDLDTHIEYAKHDRVSDGGHENPASWLGRGSPRVVKRLVGIDHLAINAAVPDDIALAPCVDWLSVVDEQTRVHPSSERHRGTPVRGPPSDFTI